MFQPFEGDQLPLFAPEDAGGRPVEVPAADRRAPRPRRRAESVQLELPETSDPPEAKR